MSTEKHTALYGWHVARGAKIVPFAGYAMPVQYEEGIVKEHLWTREHAGLFDVSHMGQVLVHGADVAASLERLLPVDLQGLAVGQQRYALLMNAQGGIDDDLMLTRRAEDFYVVVNAACKDADFAKLRAGLPDCEVSWWQARSLLALQGPEAVEVLAAIEPAVRTNSSFCFSITFSTRSLLAFFSSESGSGVEFISINPATFSAKSSAKASAT